MQIRHYRRSHRHIELKQHPRLLHLSLSGNQLEDVSIVELAKVIPLTKMEKLCLSENNLTDEGFRVIGKIIRDTPTMVTVELKGIERFTDVGANAFLQLIGTHRRLKTVVLDGPHVSMKMRRHISQYVKNLQSQKSEQLIVMCSGKMLPRSGADTLKLLPIDLIRMLKEMLPDDVL